MNLSRYPIAPISLPSGPFYRPVTITLYNTCHYFFTLCVASWEHFGNLLGPDLAHFTNVHFAPHQPMCPLLWHADLHSPPFPLWASSVVSSGFYLYLPLKPLQRFTSAHSGLHLRRDSSDIARATPLRVVRFFTYHLLLVLMRPCGYSFFVSSRVDHALMNEYLELCLTFTCRTLTISWNSRGRNKTRAYSSPMSRRHMGRV
jgi:hypothetical protein